MKKKFAFILMSDAYNPDVHQASFEKETMSTHIYTVRSFEEACSKLKELEKEGFGGVELCGAFGPEKAQQLIELTHNKIAIGYVVHNPEQISCLMPFSDTEHDSFLFSNFFLSQHACSVS